MEFWGVEVKAGEPFKVELHKGKALHLSQACIGEVKKEKGQETVCLFVNVDGKKLVLGTLLSDKLPQQMFDLVFDKGFELSHNWKNGSVFFYGYTADNPIDEDDFHDTDSESDEDNLLVANGGPTAQAKQEKPAEGQKTVEGKDNAARKQKVKIVEPNKDDKSEDDDDSSDEDDAMSEDDSEKDEDKKAESDEEEDDDDDDDDDDDSDEDEETPVQVKSGKKRSLESATKTPVPDKKAKLVTQKTDGKKSSVHVDTPHPSKQTGKTPANKPNQQTPKTEGSFSCKPCNRNFKSEVALDSHNKAKHIGK